MTIFGILLAVLCYAIQYLMNRRAFNRRNAAGVEEFKSYEAAAGTRFLEGAGRKLGSLLIIVGLILAAFGFFAHHK
ncbi:molybdenum ABC transporter permease [Hymenobacter negativus]|uniref:Molybdenum ABC transporter permease n=1 Tax=Hymenobacter negativus TaxID=2795026 RepID=A0ABS3QCG3_9BACT|nr:molybdenum ABC transporter permease [Hymenobacter negativus]MBO2008811.1 molybdenum ABC transporter permease [Hymenobacter negativus]